MGLLNKLSETCPWKFNLLALKANEITCLIAKIYQQTFYQSLCINVTIKSKTFVNYSFVWDENHSVKILNYKLYEIIPLKYQY